MSILQITINREPGDIIPVEISKEMEIIACDRHEEEFEERMEKFRVMAKELKPEEIVKLSDKLKRISKDIDGAIQLSGDPNEYLVFAKALLNNQIEEICPKT